VAVVAGVLPLNGPLTNFTVTGFVLIITTSIITTSITAPRGRRTRVA